MLLGVLSLVSLSRRSLLNRSWLGLELLGLLRLLGLLGLLGLARLAVRARF